MSYAVRLASAMFRASCAVATRAGAKSKKQPLI